MAIYNKTRIVQKIVPLQIAGAYTANDVVGGLLSFPVHSAGGGGVIRRLVIADDDNEKAALDLYLFGDGAYGIAPAAPAAIIDADAFAPVIGDLKKLLDIIHIAAADYVTINNNAYAIKNDLSIDYALNGENIYGYLVCLATPTYTAVTDLTLELTVWQD